MFVGLIAGGSIDWAERSFSGNSLLQMVLDLVLPKPTLRASGDSEPAGQGDEQQNALHPLILESEPCNASVVAVLVSSTGNI
jgi:hypothetical protein